MTAPDPGESEQSEPSASSHGQADGDQSPRLAVDERRSDVDHASPGTLVCVLGMHRSGTSFLAGSLRQAGLYLGTYYTWNPHNRRGNHENPEVYELHEDVLAENGGSWDHPPDRVRWSPAHLERARALVAKYAGDGQWGFKDPRTLLTLGGWKRVAKDLRPVGIFRNPVAVAHSLNVRGGMSAGDALDLWNHYNRLLLEEHDRQSFPILCFDWQDERLHEKTDEIVTALGLRPLGRDQRFYTPELRHHGQPPEHELPEETQAVYRKLQRVALR